MGKLTSTHRPKKAILKGKNDIVLLFRYKHVNAHNRNSKSVQIWLSNINDSGNGIFEDVGLGASN